MQEPAIGMFELSSVARGILVADAVVKKAEVRMISSHVVSSGKYLILFCGEVAEVDESYRAGVEAADSGMINKLFLPMIHPDIMQAILGEFQPPRYEAICVVESTSMVSTVKAADIAIKMAAVQVTELRLAQGLGGKGYFIMTGEHPDLEAAYHAARQHVEEDGTLCGHEFIPAPHRDITDRGVTF